MSSKPCQHPVTVRAQDGQTYCVFCCHPMVVLVEAPKEGGKRDDKEASRG